jgi:hypothetical protein
MGWTTSTNDLFQAVQNFLSLADDSNSVPKLSNGRRYSEFQLSDAEWTQLELIHNILKVRVAFPLSWC